MLHAQRAQVWAAQEESLQEQVVDNATCPDQHEACGYTGFIRGSNDING